MMALNSGSVSLKISRMGGSRYLLTNTVLVPLPVSRAFDFFKDPENLDRITPSFLRFRPENGGAGSMSKGLEITYRMRLHSVPVRWTSRISVWNPPDSFVDEQTEGPFAMWRHLHTFRPMGESSTEIADRVDYEMPFGFFGRFANFLFVKRDLESIFTYRSKRIAEILVP